VICGLTFCLSGVPFRYIDNPWVSPRMKTWRSQLVCGSNFSGNSRTKTFNFGADRTQTSKVMSNSVRPTSQVSSDASTSAMSQMLDLVRSDLYDLIVSALSCLYFVVTGVQYW